MAADQRMIDTNVLIYSTVSGNPWHANARQWLADLQGAGHRLCVSPQIVREFLVVLTRGEVFSQTFTPTEALNTFAALRPSLVILRETEEAFERLLSLVEQYDVKGKVIHDAQVVATMLANGVTHLATYKRSDFTRYTEITLESPPSPAP